MDSQHEQLPQDERGQDERKEYEAPTGVVLGTVEKLTTRVADFPSTPQQP
jgi:hypothetical protein